eukprot:GHVN01003947.1.p1 GENE.GHVN01003947.1~~GHVN01003947.1.p1  ORF type:complete len:574 (+),score=143.83 GHVN01003947.1:144-1865(+)
MHKFSNSLKAIRPTLRVTCFKREAVSPHSSLTVTPNRSLTSLDRCCLTNWRSVMTKSRQSSLVSPPHLISLTSPTSFKPLRSTDFRVETDSLGEVSVPTCRLWGAQTQRSIENFGAVGDQRMPLQIIYSLSVIKRCAAEVNCYLGLLSEVKRDLIKDACDLILTGEVDDHFPLNIWQTGSGTQTNMNMNEVIANIATLREQQESSIQTNTDTSLTSLPSPSSLTPLTLKYVHPNDDVNLGQSSNDVFPSALHMACVEVIMCKLIPAIQHMITTLKAKQETFSHIVKIGRTHMMDATPLTLGQELSAFVSQLEHCRTHLTQSLTHLSQLALGGTAVGSGINAHPKYGELACESVTQFTGHHYQCADNTFAAVASNDAVVELHGSLRIISTVLIKLASDIRLLASGPRAGLGELTLPVNEPGSSIMPGKVNPTQCESLIQVCVMVIGNDVTVGMCQTQSVLQLNVCRPVLAHTVLTSLTSLGNAISNFTSKCLEGLEANEKHINDQLNQSLMLVTSLTPHIGYDKAAQVAKKAFEEGKSLKEVTVTDLGLLSGDKFDEVVDPVKMTNQDRRQWGE